MTQKCPWAIEYKDGKRLRKGNPQMFSRQDAPAAAFVAGHFFHFRRCSGEGPIWPFVRCEAQRWPMSLDMFAALFQRPYLWGRCMRLLPSATPWFTVLRLINFAHGDILMLGAYFVFFGTFVFGYPGRCRRCCRNAPKSGYS